jgi:hypothetical protein
MKHWELVNSETVHRHDSLQTCRGEPTGDLTPVSVHDVVSDRIWRNNPVWWSCIPHSE